MTYPIDESSTANSASNSDVDSQTKYGSQFGRLAQRISGLTSNLIATAIILVLALAGGRELISWWQADPRQTVRQIQPSPAESWTAPTGSHILEFGDLPLTLQRDEIHGERDQALQRLRARCKESLNSGSIPYGEIGPAEQRLLDSTLNRVPVDEQPGQWRLFLAVDPIPMVVGIRDDCKKTVATSSKVGFQSRMVVWGMTVPSAESVSSGQSVWTNYCWRYIDQTASGNHQVEFPLPPQARKTMVVSDVNGATVTGFRATSPNETMQFYSQWADQQDLEVVKKWRSANSTWRVEYAHKDDHQSRIEIQLVLEGDQSIGDQSILGLITTSPAR